MPSLTVEAPLEHLADEETGFRIALMCVPCLEANDYLLGAINNYQHFSQVCKKHSF